MILNIHLKNFTIIDELDLEFKTGMLTLTGETGAGKSIIIDAISLALGARLENKVVREGQEKADITVGFSINKNPAVIAWLQQHELTSDHECIIRRSISKEGRSRNFINGNPVTLQLLNDLGNLLINIHGQHEQQNLIKKNMQLQLVDTFGQHEQSLAAISDIYIRWKEIKDSYEKLQQLSQEKNNRRDFLQYQLTELAKLNLTANEVEQLGQEHKQLSQAESLLQNCQQAINYLSGTDVSTEKLLNSSVQCLENIKNAHPKIDASLQLLQDAAIQIQEANNEIQRFFDKVELNPARLQEIDQRLTAIHDLARKHRVNATELYNLQQQLAAELQTLNNSDSKLAELADEMQSLAENYLIIANRLTKDRETAAKKLEKLITKDMHELGMQGGQFIIRITQHDSNEPNPFGLERAEFWVSANPGQAPQPLAKVASGGELSRISLAIQVNTAKIMQVPTLIFDEVDTGVGGGVAEMIGRLLRKLGENGQVFCITHLPQVASLAHYHYQVTKNKTKDQTTVSICELSITERVEEIARMLGGIKITQQTREHAKEMLEIGIQ